MFKRLCILSLGTFLVSPNTHAALSQWAFMSPASNMTCPLFQPTGTPSQNPTYVSPMLPGIQHPDYSNGMDALKESFADILPAESVKDRLERILIPFGSLYDYKEAVERMANQGLTPEAIEEFRQFVMLTHHEEERKRPGCTPKGQIIRLNHILNMLFDEIRQEFGIQKESSLSINKSMLERIKSAMFNLQDPFLDTWVVRFNSAGKRLTENGDLMTLNEHDMLDIANGDFVYFPFYTLTYTRQCPNQLQEVGAIIVGSSDPFQADVSSSECGYTPHFDRGKTDFIIKLTRKLEAEIAKEKKLKV